MGENVFKKEIESNTCCIHVRVPSWYLSDANILLSYDINEIKIHHESKFRYLSGMDSIMMVYMVE